MGLLNIFKRERSLEDLASTEHIFMAGYREGSPCEGDQPTSSNVDRNHPDFRRGLKAGRKTFNDLKRSHPYMIVNGVIRDDSEDE